MLHQLQSEYLKGKGWEVDVPRFIKKHTAVQTRRINLKRRPETFIYFRAFMSHVRWIQEVVHPPLQTDLAQEFGG